MNFKFLSFTQLFNGIEPDEIKKMMPCLCAFEKHFEKDEIIYHMGDVIQNIGLILCGSVNIETIDFEGNKAILGNSLKGQLFAESYACLSGEPLMVNVSAAESVDILFLNVKKVYSVCQNSCMQHTKLIRNLLLISAQKNLNLSRRILHTSKKTIRGRLISYFSFEMRKQSSMIISIHFDRQQLADYLNVDRSALSHELSKMKDEGILESKKNVFRINWDLQNQSVAN